MARQSITGCDIKYGRIVLQAYPITLLAGNSGVGKTSLIHAGLSVSETQNIWLGIYIRETL